MGLTGATTVVRMLERAFGRVRVPRRLRAFDLLVRAQCGYPASEEACEKGYAALASKVGTRPEQILAAKPATLVAVMRAGGIVPDVRAERLREISAQVQAGADLRDRRVLLRLPTIGEPGADAILLMSRVDAVAAVPSNALQVAIRLGFGEQRPSYAATYRSAKQALDAELPRSFDARIQAYLVFKRHGQTLCRRTRPRCELCPLTKVCPSFAAGLP